VNARGRVLLFLKGMAMGAADSVPGVSGGTIAFIANIYDELLGSIMAVNTTTARVLFSRGFKAAWLAVNGEFLLILACGLLASLVLFANIVLYLLAEHYAVLMSFFIGLILASIWYVHRQIPAWTLPRTLLLLAGTAASVLLALVPPFQGVDNLLYYFLCGAVAICAMILPGISGAFVLLLLGAYENVLRALTGMDWPVILVFAAGCATGLLSFARLLFWLLRDFRAPTLALLLGVLAGSLYNLWPWRELEVSNTAGLPQYYNISPLQWMAEQGGAALLFCLLLAVAGFLLVWSLETVVGNPGLGKSGSKSNSSGN